ncbi:MAG: DUF1559 domain-containing protein [Pirellulales bacterium]
MAESAKQNEDGPRYSLRELFVLTAVVGVFFALGGVFVRSQQEVARRAKCTGLLKQVGIALHNYHATDKCFPPAYFADADGKPMHSWRVILLPYFGDAASRALYQQYRFDEPWDGPNNRTLAGMIPQVYRCPSSTAPVGETSYTAVVGPEAGWPGSEARNIGDFTDGLSSTIALVEIAESGINWMEPRDLTFTQAAQGVNPPLAKL